MSEPVSEHQHGGPARVRCAVITVSDTRTLQTDRGGQTIVECLSSAGHEIIAREIVPDEPARLRSTLTHLPPADVVLVTGGTGLSHRDQTFETVHGLLTKPMPGYGELFRMLSYEQIGPAAMLSRATGGLIGHTVLLTMPGSPAAVRLALEKLILPELSHLVAEARK